MMEPGERSMGGIVFRVVDPARNAGKSRIVLRGKNREYFPGEARVAVEGQGKMLFLLNGLAWPPAKGAVCGEVEVVYADGTYAHLRNSAMRCTPMAICSASIALAPHGRRLAQLPTTAVRRNACAIILRQS